MEKDVALGVAVVAVVAPSHGAAAGAEGGDPQVTETGGDASATIPDHVAEDRGSSCDVFFLLFEESTYMPMRGKYLKNSRWLVRECELEKKNCVFFLALLKCVCVCVCMRA